MPDIKNKKKKRSFMQQMKKMKRSMDMKRGKSQYKMSDEEYNHYLRVFEQLKNIDKDERGLLVKNVLREIVQGENLKTLASNKLVSRILDDILPEALTKDILQFLQVFSEDLRPICVDPFASHVLQTLLNIAFRNIQNGATEKVEDPEEEPSLIDEDSKKTFKSFLIKVSKFIYNNLEDFIQDMYASYVVRTILEICSGVTISDSVKCSKKAQTFHSLREDVKQILEVPEDLTSVWYQTLERMEHLPQFEKLILNDSGSAALQTALLTLSERNEKERLISLASHIIEHGFMKHEDETAQINPIFSSHSTCRLMEVLVSVVPEKEQELIYRGFFRNQMISLVEHEIGYHAIEKLFASWKSKRSFPAMVMAHNDCLKEAFSRKRFKILYSAVQSCRRLNSHQSRIEKDLMEILGIHENEELKAKFAILLLHMVTWTDYENQEKQKLPCSSMGTFIIEEMLQFKNPLKIVSSILNMSPSELFEMAVNPRGSHVIDAFASGPNVEATSKIELYEKFKGLYVSLACNKFGSYSLEHIWDTLSVNLKTELCKELYKSRNQLQDNAFGLIIYNKFQLQHFSENESKDWKELQEKASNKKLLLKRMLEETSDEKSSSKPKKKKK